MEIILNLLGQLRITNLTKDQLNAITDLRDKVLEEYKKVN